MIFDNLKSQPNGWLFKLSILGFSAPNALKIPKLFSQSGLLSQTFTQLQQFTFML
jgi:hypothetical protein